MNEHLNWPESFTIFFLYLNLLFFMRPGQQASFHKVFVCKSAIWLSIYSNGSPTNHVSLEMASPCQPHLFRNWHLFFFSCFISWKVIYCRTDWIATFCQFGWYFWSFCCCTSWKKHYFVINSSMISSHNGILKFFLSLHQLENKKDMILPLMLPVLFTNLQLYSHIEF